MRDERIDYIDEDLGEVAETVEDLGKDVDDMKDLMGAYGAPTPPSSDNLFRFLRDILTLKNSDRVGNLKDSELGMPKKTVRSYLMIKEYCKAEGLHRVADYMQSHANIVTSTSMSRKGYFLGLGVTQVKREQKIRTDQPQFKKTLFGMKEVPQDEQNQ